MRRILHLYECVVFGRTLFASSKTSTEIFGGEFWFFRVKALRTNAFSRAYTNGNDISRPVSEKRARRARRRPVRTSVCPWRIVVTFLKDGTKELDPSARSFKESWRVLVFLTKCGHLLVFLTKCGHLLNFLTKCGHLLFFFNQMWSPVLVF